MATLADYTPSDGEDHRRARRIIARELKEHHQGRYTMKNGERVSNTISSADLADIVTEQLPDDREIGASTLRDLIPDVREQYLLPIGNANGYFVIQDPEQAREQIDRQIRRANTSRDRARDISRACYQSGVLDAHQFGDDDE